MWYSHSLDHCFHFWTDLSTDLRLLYADQENMDHETQKRWCSAFYTNKLASWHPWVCCGRGSPIKGLASFTLCHQELSHIHTMAAELLGGHVTPGTSPRWVWPRGNGTGTAEIRDKTAEDQLGISTRPQKCCIKQLVIYFWPQAGHHVATASTHLWCEVVECINQSCKMNSAD